MTQKNTFRHAIYCLGFLLCFAFTASNIYGQATPPVIQWQYSNTPQFSPDPNSDLFVLSKAVDVHGINFKGDYFDNETAYISGPQYRGYGIFSIDASYNVIPSTVQVSNFSGFSYGIYATSTLHYPIYVNGTSLSVQNTFSDNIYDIYEGGTSLSQIEYNSFSKDNSLATISSGLVPPFVNVFMDASQAYEVEGNNFTAQAAAGTPPTYGNVASNSLGNSCQINNNNYSGSGSNNLSLGNYAQGTNWNNLILGSTGLQYTCNNYAYPIPNSDEVVSANGSINYYQGGNSNPAGNAFSGTCGLPPYDIENNGGTMFKYYYHTPGPTPCTLGVSLDPTTLLSNCVIPSGSSGNNSNLAVLLIIQHNDQRILDSLNNILAAGDAASLYFIINTGTPSQIQDSLLAPGPYLSDSVLIAAISENLPPGTIKNILIPNSPLDSAVMAALNSVSLPPGIRNQVNNVQTGTSARSNLESDIGYYTNEVGLATNAIASFYLRDTIPGAIDSAIAVLKPYLGTCDELLPLAALQVATGDTAAADTTVSIIKAMGGVKYDNFCTLLPLLIKLQYAPTHYFELLHDPYDSATVANIAQDSTSPGYVEARAVMTLVFNKQYNPVFWPISNNNNERHLSPNTNSTSNIQNSAFSLYPNPANTQIIIKTTIPLGEKGYIYLYNTVGELVKSEELENNVTLCNVM